MERDNSNSKSRMQLKIETMNEELNDFRSSILSGIRTIEENRIIEEKVKKILEIYLKSIVEIQENILILTTEKIFIDGVEDDVDLSEYNFFLSKSRKKLEEDEYKKMKSNFLKK